jgi:hypothetical protein
MVSIDSFVDKISSTNQISVNQSIPQQTGKRRSESAQFFELTTSPFKAKRAKVANTKYQ